VPPLAILFSKVPPDEAVYQSILFPVDVAVSELALPHTTLAGVAVTAEGVATFGVVNAADVP